ncbi:amidohydrolase family protein [Paracoccus jeotgali]|uniref:amidohydrolase family protein n=1 Tax=Paracoccus jeotgali TaxID=2065379 RepID=UPI0028ACE660|nr:amidohydrolase family protein [Paracoccus jeotgali]
MAQFRSGISRRDVLIGGVAGGLLASQKATAASYLMRPHLHAAGQADGCIVCGAARAAQYSDAVMRKPQPLGAQLLRVQAGAPQRASGDAGPGGSSRVLVVRPNWVMVPKGDTIDVLSDHDVVVRDDRIEEVRPRRATSDLALDAPGQFLVPGFISGHSHAAAASLTRGWIEENSRIDRSGPSRSYFAAMDLIDSLDDEELDDLTALNLAEMVRSGCTTQVEMSLSLKQVQSYVRVAQRFGLRGFASGMVPGMTRLGPIWNRPLESPEVLEEADPETIAEIAANLDYARAVHGSADGRIQMMMACGVTPAYTRASMQALLDAAVELGTGTHVHIQAGGNPHHNALIHQYWDMREMEVIEATLMSQKVFGAHCIGLEDIAKDLAIMADPNFTFVHCPSAGGAGVSPSSQVFPEALAAGVNTSIGYDTHSNDYVENLKLATMQGRARAQLLHKTSPVPMKEPTIWDALESATLAGARGLGRPDLGRIEAGAKADMTLIDVTGLLIGNGGLPREPWNNLLYANGLSVANVMVDGEWKVRNGNLVFADAAALQARGAAASQKIWDRLEAEGHFAPMPRR